MGTEALKKDLREKIISCQYHKRIQGIGNLLDAYDSQLAENGTREELAEAAFFRGEASFWMGRYTDTVEFLTKSIGMKKNREYEYLDIQAYNVLGMVFSFVGYETVALTNYLQAAKTAEKNQDIEDEVVVLLNAGLLYAGLGDYRKALEYVQNGGTDPKNAPECQCIFKLMEAVDSYIPAPERDTDKPFLMPVEDVFSITGRGTVATGRVERGVVKVSDTVEIVGLQDKPRSTVVTGVEMFRKLLDQAEAGDNIGVLLRGIQRNEVERGQVLAKPGSIHPHTHYMGQVYVLTKEEGGRHTPFFNGYRPQFYFRTTDVTGNIKLPDGTEMVMPGDNIDMEITLITPIALEQGLRFAIREGGRTVGSGVVAKVIE